MRKSNRPFILLVLLAMATGLFLIAPVSGMAQSVKNLEVKKKNLYKELELSNQLLKETRSAQATSIKELKLLNEQLSTREKLIETLSDQLSLAEKNISDKEQEIDQKELELVEQQEDYAEMVRYAYKNQLSQNMLLFLVSSSSFNDAFQRVRYIKQCNDHRARQVVLIKAQKDTLGLVIEELEAERGRKSQLVDEEKAERNKLLSQKKQKSGLLDELKEKESELNHDVDKKQVAIESLNREIDSAIRKSMQAKKTAEAAKTKPKSSPPKSTSKPKSTPSTSSPNTSKPAPKTTKLAPGFSKNKGRLPWPVNKGIITGKFGRGKYSSEVPVDIDNTGIDISTPKGSKVQAIYEGEVSTIIYSPIFQSAIIIEHGGDYYSVYSNVTDVQVNKGDKVKANDIIATAHTNSSGNTEVHLEIWKANDKMNPSIWLKKR